jgi:hypothetical protein
LQARDSSWEDKVADILKKENANKFNDSACLTLIFSKIINVANISDPEISEELRSSCNRDATILIMMLPARTLQKAHIRGAIVRKLSSEEESAQDRAVRLKILTSASSTINSLIGESKKRSKLDLSSPHKIDSNVVAGEHDLNLSYEPDDNIGIPKRRCGAGAPRDPGCPKTTSKPTKPAPQVRKPATRVAARVIRKGTGTTHKGNRL